MVNITLPDGAQKSYDNAVSGLEVAKSISPKLAKQAVAITYNDEVKDLSFNIESDGNVSILTKTDEKSLELIRHSTAHLLAFAVQNLWKGTQVTIGPVIKDGFFYDFDFPEDVKISDADLPKIEKEMRKILKRVQPFIRRTVTRENAVETFRGMGEHFKVELLEAIPEGEALTLYDIGGGWFDLCRGPHVASTKFLGAFKLTHIAGAFWRGDEKNKQLTRIYGTAWSTEEELKDHLHRLEEAKKRDHRVLGKQLDLFSFHEETPANPFFHAKGKFIYNQLENYVRDSNTKFGFDEVGTPLIMNVDLWHKSGHYDNYKENMYFTDVDDREAAIKPMNCPGHCLIYKTTKKSYRNLPVRMSEFGRVHRHERSGATHGLFRVRTFVQDDAHIFCTPEQIHEELQAVLEQIFEVYNHLGFKGIKLELSTRPEKSIGSDEIWEKAEKALEEVLVASGKEWQLNPGDGAFYGPKIDCHLVDSIGRTWQCGTVQLDFSMPERFGLEFTGADDNNHHPVMIHRAVLGSLERFLGILIENYAGHFPLWLAPEQVRIVPVKDAHKAYAQEIVELLLAKGFRATIDERNERLGFKIREAQLEKIPYMAVVGDKEIESRTISARKAKGGEEVDPMSLTDFVDYLAKQD